MNPLSDKKALIVGIGGLGCPAALALAEAGVGHLTLVDPDRVELSNLHRQPLHRDADLGRPKVESAREALGRRYPRLSIEAVPTRVDAANVDRLFAAHHLVLDGTDQISTKLLLSDAAVRLGAPLVYAGVLRMEGQLMLIAPGGPCLRCLFEEPPSGERLPTCAQAGVLGSMAGVVGAAQGLVGVRTLEGRAEPGRLLRFDGTSLAQRSLRVARAADCVTCGTRAEVAPCAM